MKISVYCLLWIAITCMATAANAETIFSDDFSTDTTGDYTLLDTETGGGFGEFLYDTVGQRLHVLTGDGVGLQFSKDLPALTSGTFSIDFLPTAKYPRGGIFGLRLVQDQSNYYQVMNTDGYGAKELWKVVDGHVVDSVSFQNEYTQNNDYHIAIDFDPSGTTVDAFGEQLVVNSDTSVITVNSFEIELKQQDAYFDNIIYTDTSDIPPLIDEDIEVTWDRPENSGDWARLKLRINGSTVIDIADPDTRSWTGILTLKTTQNVFDMQACNNLGNCSVWSEPAYFTPSDDPPNELPPAPINVHISIR